MSDLADRLQSPEGAEVRAEVERRLSALKLAVASELRGGRSLEEFDRLRAFEAGLDAAMSVMTAMTSKPPLATRTRVNRDRS